MESIPFQDHKNLRYFYEENLFLKLFLFEQTIKIFILILKITEVEIFKLKSSYNLRKMKRLY